MTRFEKALLILGLVVSLVSAGISWMTFQIPNHNAAATKTNLIETYLTGITSTNYLDVRAGRASTEYGTDADLYAQTLERLWSAEDSFGDNAFGGRSSTFRKAAKETYEVCFVKLETLPSKCQTFGKFKFSEDLTSIQSFTIDDAPIRLLNTKPSDTYLEANTDAKLHVQLAGSIQDPSRKWQTVVLRLRSVDNTAEGSLTFAYEYFDIKNEAGAKLHDWYAHFPAEIKQYGSVKYAVVKVPSATIGFVKVCTATDGKSTACTWLSL